MFAYCGNNPICYSDFSGAIRVCAEDRKHCYTPVTEQMQASTPEDQVYGIVNGQALLPYADQSIGWGSCKNSGCAYIAAYNALQLAGNGKPLATVTDEIYAYYGSVLFGALGVAPKVLTDYVGDQVTNSITAKNVNLLLDGAQDGSVFTFTVMNKSGNIFKGWHAMTAIYSDGQYLVFNRYSDRSNTYELSSLEDAFKDGRFLYGIRIDP